MRDCVHLAFLMSCAAARDKRYTVRDFTFEAGKADAEDVKKLADTDEFNRLQRLLVNWYLHDIVSTI